MMDDKDGYEVKFIKVGNTEYSLWLFTEDYLEATTECDELIKRDFVKSVKLMKVKSVQVYKIDKQ